MAAQQIIRRFLWISGLYTLSASLIWGVNTLFLMDAGLDIFEVFIANASFTVGMVIFEIPTGVLADTTGRRASFLLSVIVLAIGTLGYVSVSQFAEGSLPLFVVFSIVLGLGFTFYSGAVEAWLVDALNTTDYEGTLDSVFARGAMVTGAAMLVGTVGGGFMGNIDLALPFVGRAVLLIILFFIALRGMHDIGYQPRALHMGMIPGEMRKIARESLQYGWQQRPVRLLMVISLLQGLYSVWGFYAWQPYFLELLGRDAIWVAGVVAALLSLSMICGNMLVDRFTRYTQKRTTLLIGAALVQAVAVFCIGLAGNFYEAVFCLLVSAVAMGAFLPVRQSFMHHLIPSDKRATVLSFDGMVGSGGSVIGQPVLGYVGEARSVAAGYLISGGILVLVAPVLFALRNLSSEGDIIEGQPGAQAVQGVSTFARHDTQPLQPIVIVPDTSHDS